MTSSAISVLRSSSARMDWLMASSTDAPIRSRRSFSSSMSSSECRCMVILRTLAEPTGDVLFGQLLLRRHEDIVGLVVFDQPSEHEEGGSIGYASGLLHVVRDDHDRVILFEIVNQLFDLRRGNRIERGG